MKLRYKSTSIIVVLFIIIITFIILFWGQAAKKNISVSDIKEIKLYYRYSLDQKEVSLDDFNEVISLYNDCLDYDKVHSEELPCYTLTAVLRNGSKLHFIDLHSDGSILVEYVFFGKTTKYELYDKELLESVKRIIKDNYELHENEVCKKYS
jgi:uncharacterized membrane protein